MFINSSKDIWSSLSSVKLRNPARVPHWSALSLVGWVYIATSFQVGHKAARVWQHIRIAGGQPLSGHRGSLLPGLAGRSPTPSQGACLSRLGAELDAAWGGVMLPAEKQSCSLLLCLQDHCLGSFKGPAHRAARAPFGCTVQLPAVL